MKRTRRLWKVRELGEGLRVGFRNGVVRLGDGCCVVRSEGFILCVCVCLVRPVMVRREFGEGGECEGKWIGFHFH